MIGYVTLGTNNMQRAAAFYDALLGDLGASQDQRARPRESREPILQVRTYDSTILSYDDMI